MRSSLFLATVLMSVVMFVVDAAAEDRRGFCSGGEVGFAPVSRCSFGGVKAEASSLGFEVVAGYGSTARDVLSLELIWFRQESDNLTERGSTTEHLDGSPLGDQTVTQDLFGIVSYHHLSQKSQSPYTAAGEGMVAFSKSDFGKDERGLG